MTNEMMISKEKFTSQSLDYPEGYTSADVEKFPLA